ncbi:MAG TPA: AMP-binding protein, partial [Xanthomonadaceae bacterium]|nr:AMP-binding protein [Xanthomonadaceae bacterium]
MTQTRPWLANYPPGVGPEVNLDEFKSIVAVLESSCQRFRDRPAYRNFGTTLTYGDLDRMSSQFAAYLLRDLQLKKGDRVAIMMPNLLQYPVAIMGILRAGLIVVNTNPLYTARELRHQLKDSGALAIVVVDNFANTVQEVLADTDVKQVITTGVGDLLKFPKGLIVNFVLKYIKKQIPAYTIPGAIRFDEALRRGRRHNLPLIDIEPGDIAFLQYTGGTTGVSKGAMLTHRNIVANMQQASSWIGGQLKPGQEVIITALPLYHIFSL